MSERPIQSGRETPSDERIAALLADERLDQLSPEDRAELETLRARGLVEDDDSYAVGEMLLAMDEASGVRGEMPASLRARLEAGGRAAVAGRGVDRVSRGPGSGSGLGWLAAAAGLLLAVGVGAVAWTMIDRREQEVEAFRGRVALLEAQVEENQRVLASAREARASLEAELAEAADREIDLAERLASATSDLDTARLEIARYEQPRDPEELAANRRRLLEVPDTIRVAWQPFNLPDSPAEQPEVQGDVVWNDELQQGYLRFVGLDVNDPNLEQYQVWVIDERGLEQKVSGGVFNATAQGEVIVPIEPGIDVGRVALFAVTVENPGGTWVPDLKRRVVVAPREES